MRFQHSVAMLGMQMNCISCACERIVISWAQLHGGALDLVSIERVSPRGFLHILSVETVKKGSTDHPCQHKKKNATTTIALR